MRKLLVLLMLLGLTLCAGGALPLKLDVGRENDPVQAGWQKLVSTGTYDGITVTLSGTGSVDYRYRTDSPYEGIDEEFMWRDFIFDASGHLIVTIEGLLPNVLYEISVAAFDYGTRSATPRTADWQVNGQTVFTMSYGIPDVPLATMMPSEEWCYIGTAWIVSNADGKIILQTAPSAVGSYTPRLNGLIINVSIQAQNPSPQNGQTAVALDTSLSWQPGSDPNNPTEPFPSIAAYYLYVTENEPNFVDVAAITIPAGDPIEPVVTYEQIFLKYDTTYYWRVDEGVYINGAISGPSDPQTLVGKVWSFETVKSIPVITQGPNNTKVRPGQTGQLNVGFISLSPANVQWYKEDILLNEDDKLTIETTESSSTLFIAEAALSDEGTYYCVIQNAGGEVISQPAELAIERLLAHYEFEQNLLDSAGDMHGTAVGGMDYVEGIAGMYAADPNGTNYVNLTTMGYPRAGYGNGLEEFTYSFWVKRGTYAGNARIFGNFNDGTNTAVQINVTGAGAVGFYLRQEGNIALDFNTPNEIISKDQWHHIAIRYDTTQIRLFVDGVARYYINASPLTNFADWQYPMTVFARNVRGTVGEFYPGQADDLRIYNYSLAAEEIGQLYYEVSGQVPCIYGYPSFDVSGPDGQRDCVVDLYDFAAFSAQWLTNGLLDIEN